MIYLEFSNELLYRKRSDVFCHVTSRGITLSESNARRCDVWSLCEGKIGNDGHFWLLNVRWLKTPNTPNQDEFAR